jgi:phenol hydroxylase P0 protein
LNVTSFDPTRRFVRVVERRPDGLVEFEFAVGEPELFVEMLLPLAAFESFCADQGVSPADFLPATIAGDALRADEAWTWTLHEAVAREKAASQEPAPPSVRP